VFKTLVAAVLSLFPPRNQVNPFEKLVSQWGLSLSGATKHYNVSNEPPPPRSGATMHKK